MNNTNNTPNIDAKSELVGEKLNIFGEVIKELLAENHVIDLNSNTVYYAPLFRKANICCYNSGNSHSHNLVDIAKFVNNIGVNGTFYTYNYWLEDDE